MIRPPWLNQLRLLPCLALVATSAHADLTNPATLDIRETTPQHFAVALTLPIVQGQIIKARPVLPEPCVVEGEAVEHTAGLSAVRTWEMACDPAQLAGSIIGVSGLLGTVQDVRLTFATLDRREHVQVLHATQPYFVIPPPPTLLQVVSHAGSRGVQETLRHPELALLLMMVVLLGLRPREVAIGIGAFAVSHALGQWLAAHNWMTASAFLPRCLAAFAALLAALPMVRRLTSQTHGNRWQICVACLGLGALYGASQSATATVAGWSQAERQSGFVLYAAGSAVGLLLLAVCVHQLGAALASLPAAARERWRFRVAYLAGVSACALFLYQASTLLFTGEVIPSMPPVSIIFVIVAALWCATQTGRQRIGAMTMLTVGIVAGGWLGLLGFTLPLTTLAVYGMLAGLGVVLLTQWGIGPPWLGSSLVAMAGLYHGSHAAAILRDDTSLPVAHTVGLGAVLALLLLASCRLATHAAASGNLRNLRVVGATATLLAVLWRIVEYRQWLDAELATQVALGYLPVPLLAIALLAAAVMLWPRHRRFQLASARSPGRTHWVLLGVAFFALPLGTWRVSSPFHTARAPTAAEAQRIVHTLLSDTYLAFNLTDEDAAFDRLSKNLSQDLVPDVYLDSRRRLTAGTKKGAEVRVKDVRVASIEPLASGVHAGEAADSHQFSYLCTWVVTARVRHWQHIHDRRNVYVGELVLRIEDEGWKISRLALESEERVVLSGNP